MDMPETEATQRLCPFCNEPKDSQGLYMHVRNTSGDGHGEYGSVPEGFEVRDAELVTEDQDTVEVEELQQDAEQAPNTLFVCDYCGQDKKGERGLAIHLSKSAGDEMHPEGASINDGNFATVPADENYNPLIEEDTMEKIRTKTREDTEQAQFEIVEPEQTESQERAQARSEAVSDSELEESSDTIFVPEDSPMTEQVAAIITQEPGLYNQPEMVRDMVDCSRTTFYEGRKLYDANAQVQTEPDQPEEAPAEEPEPEPEPEDPPAAGPHSVIVDGVKMIPITDLMEAQRRIAELEEELSEQIDRY